MNISNPNPRVTYTPSGVPWLGDMPAHWDVRRAGWLFRKMDRPVQDTDQVVTCFRDGTVTLRKNRRTEGFTESLQEIGYQGIRRGDLVIHQMDAFAGAVGVSDSDGKGTPVYSVCYPTHDADPFYYAHVVREMARNQWILALAKGIRERSTDFRYSEFARQEFPLPPLLEQRTIVRYLDYVDQRIRRYVSAKRRLIALLEEEKQAIINQAVTRGLDPNVRLKPSGVEWLGDVPAHWEVPRLRNLGDALIGLTYDPQDVVDEEAGMLVLRASNILDGQLVYGDNVYVRSTVPDKLVTREGDILICSRSGSRALIGKNARINAESAGTTFGAFMTVFRGAHNDYLHQLFNSRFFEYQSAAFFTSTINQLTLGILYGMKVPFPPLEERQSILRYTEETTAPIIKAIVRARRQIELVQEYRTRLIADVVTGKLDVREAAAQLPDETDDQDPIEESGPLADGMDEALYDIDESAEELAIESEVSA